MNEDAMLRVVTMPAEPVGPPCDGTYLCECLKCRGEVATLAARGVRPSTPLPVKRAA